MYPALQEALIDYTGHNLHVLQLSRNTFQQKKKKKGTKEGLSFKNVGNKKKISHENK